MSERAKSTGSRDRSREELDARLARLIEAAPDLLGGPEQRREPLIEQAESRGVERPVAEQAYDVAREVGLEPAVALAVVMEGLSVQPLGGASADVEAADPVEPEWVDAPPSAEEASREWRLRQTFRRVRSLLEQEPEPASAFRALGREPDLEPYDF